MYFLYINLRPRSDTYLQSDTVNFKIFSAVSDPRAMKDSDRCSMNGSDQCSIKLESIQSGSIALGSEQSVARPNESGLTASLLIASRSGLC